MIFRWERISGKPDDQSRTFRVKVLRGWIVETNIMDEDFGAASSSVFIPDPKHEWTIDNE